MNRASRDEGRSAHPGATTEVDGFLKRLHHSAVDANAAEVVIDMRALELMDSSCFMRAVFDAPGKAPSPHSGFARASLREGHPLRRHVL